MPSSTLTSGHPLPPDEDRAHILEGVWWTEVALASIFIALRYWTRVNFNGKLMLDDIVMGLSWLCFLGDGIVIQIMGETGGARHFFYLNVSEQQEQTKLLLITLFIGIPCTGLGKIAIGITILKIIGNTSNWQRWSVWFIMGFTVVTVLADMLLVMFRCGDPTQLWDFVRLAEAIANHRCIDAGKRDKFNLFSAAWQVLADFFFSLLPMYIVWQLNLSSRKKVYLMIALGLTMFTGVAGIIKTVHTSTVTETDPTWSVFHGLIWFGTEAMLIIVCGSIPALHPLWDRLAIWSNSTNIGTSGYGGKFRMESSQGGSGIKASSRFPFQTSTGDSRQEQSFQTDDDSTRNFNFALTTNSDVELKPVAGRSVPRSSTSILGCPRKFPDPGQYSSGSSWFLSGTRCSDEEKGGGQICVKKEIIVSRPKISISPSG